MVYSKKITYYILNFFVVFAFFGLLTVEKIGMLKLVKKLFFGGVGLRLAVLFAGIFSVSEAMASGSNITLTTITSNVSAGVVNVAKILQDIALVAGIGFIFAAFFKFHAHKMQPQQVPLSQGVALLLVGAGLAVFPHLLDTATKGVFGTDVQHAGGTSIKGIIGSGG